MDNEEQTHLSDGEIEILAMTTLVQVGNALEKLAEAQMRIAVATEQQAAVQARSQKLLEDQVESTKAMVDSLKPKDPLAEII